MANEGRLRASEDVGEKLDNKSEGGRGKCHLLCFRF